MASETNEKKLQETVLDIARRARSAARELARISTGDKDEALKLIANNLRARTEFILDRNSSDVDRAREAGLSAAMIDRLTHHAEIIRVAGKSYRVHESELRKQEKMIKAKRPNGRKKP